jgi:hypothetical protein
MAQMHLQFIEEQVAQDLLPMANLAEDIMILAPNIPKI